MSIRKLVSIEHAIQNMMDDIGMENTRMFPVLMRWARDADQAIQGFNTYLPFIKVLTWSGNVAVLPNNITILSPDMLWGDHGCDCFPTFQTIRNYYAAAGASANSWGPMKFNSDGCSLQVSRQNQYHIQDNKLIMDFNMDGKKTTILYYGYQYTSNGYIMVNENHLEAIAKYLEWMLAKQTRWKKREYVMTKGVVLDIAQEWVVLARSARAADGEMTVEEEARVIQMRNNPYSGIQYCTYVYQSPSQMFNIL